MTKYLLLATGMPDEGRGLTFGASERRIVTAPVEFLEPGHSVLYAGSSDADNCLDTELGWKASAATRASGLSDSIRRSLRRLLLSLPSSATTSRSIKGKLLHFVIPTGHSSVQVQPVTASIQLPNFQINSHSSLLSLGESNQLLTSPPFSSLLSIHHVSTHTHRKKLSS